MIMVKFYKDGYVVEVRNEMQEGVSITVISIPLECVEKHQLLKNYPEDEFFKTVVTNDHVLINSWEGFELNIIDSNPIITFFTTKKVWDLDVEQMTLTEAEPYQYRFVDESPSGKCEVIDRRTKKITRLLDEDVKVSGLVDMVDREALRKILLPARLRKLK